MSATQSNVLAFFCGATIASVVLGIVLCVVMTRQSSALRVEYERGIATGERQQAFNDSVMGRR